ncbi:hypothetical protein B0O99DRAFT_685251 [Bisporella sp. PMI_857]|nr:hypothetical protein B0O99DRAFT_685251 [Bisporella sp. PMI_857]
MKILEPKSVRTAVIGPNSDAILTNFFEISLDPPKNVYRYSISLGEIPLKEDGLDTDEKRQPTNVVTKRVSTKSLLESRTSAPSHSNWACDCDAIIASGELYPHNNFRDGITTKNHLRSAANDKEIEMESKINLLGQVDLPKLKQLLTNNSPRPYYSDEELKALNMISWKFITGSGFAGGRHGNRTYPAQQSKPDMDSAYQICDGFFTSMRFGQGAVLLNINTVNSAFYPPTLLSTWIKSHPKLGSNFSIEDFESGLKDILVTSNRGEAARRCQNEIFCIGKGFLEDEGFLEVDGDSSPRSLLIITWNGMFYL